MGPHRALQRNEDFVLLGRVIGVFLRKLFAWQRRRARAHGIAAPQGGAVTFIQRFGSLRNLNCHAHALLPDGMFAAELDGAVRFHPLPPPWDHDVTRLLGQIARAIHRLVEHHLALREGDHEPPDLLAAEQAEAVPNSPAPVAEVAVVWTVPEFPNSVPEFLDDA